MAKHYLEQVSGALVTSATTGVLKFRSTVSGTIEAITIFTEEDVSSDVTFDVNKGATGSDQTTLFSGTKPKILSGNHLIEVIGLSIVCSVGDLITVDVDTITDDINLATVLVKIEDGDNSSSKSYFSDHFFSTLTNKWRSETTNGSVTEIDSELGYPGLLRITTSGASNNVVGIALASSSSFGTIHSSQNFDMLIWVRPVQNDGDIIVRVGLFNKDFKNSFSEGVFFQKEYGNNYFKGYTRSSSTQSATSAFSAYTANTWQKFRIRRIDASTIGFTIEGQSEQTITSNIPSTVLVLAIYVVTQDGSSKNLDVDYVDISTL